MAASDILAHDPNWIARLHGSLRRRVETWLFDPAANVAELETAYVEMCCWFKEGETPASFSATGARVEIKPKEMSTT